MDAQQLRQLGKKLSNWGKWGPNDEKGTLNYITPEKVVQATKLVKKGKIIRLGLNYDGDGPQVGVQARRFNPIHMMLIDGSDAVAGVPSLAGGFQHTDDVIIMPLQCATQWDALSHGFYDSVMYNGYSAREVTSAGAAKNGIEKICEGVLSRGVLLDMARYKGKAILDPGYPITVDDLEGCARAEKVNPGSGDVLLIRTGWIRHLVVDKNKAAFAGREQPGLSALCLEWLHQKQVAAVAADNTAVEVRPSGFQDLAIPLHMVAIRDMGMLLGEMFSFEALAEDCAKDSVYELLFVGSPLPFTGAVGSPLNPLAVK